MNYQQERKPGTGRLWVQNKSQHPQAPQFTGELKTPDGRVWRISMWESRDRDTNQFNGFSIKAQAPQQQQTQPQQSYQPQGTPQQGQGWQAPPGGPPDTPPPQGEGDYGTDDPPWNN